MPASTPISLARKARSHLDKVIQMLEEDRYCIDILQQALAIQGLVKRMILDIFSRHLRTCFAKGVCSTSSRDQEKLLSELEQVLRLSQRS
jgi:DNA-binding FrmR family transcriptional regulator